MHKTSAFITDSYANKHLIIRKGLSASCNIFVNLLPILARDPDHPTDQQGTIYSSVASLTTSLSTPESRVSGG